jgi:hypothetical protein
MPTQFLGHSPTVSDSWAESRAWLASQASPGATSSVSRMPWNVAEEIPGRGARRGVGRDLRRWRRIRTDSTAKRAAELVTAEMMSRVRRNAARLEQRLRAHGYLFAVDQPGQLPQPGITPPAPNLDPTSRRSGQRSADCCRSASAHSCSSSAAWNLRGTLPGCTPSQSDPPTATRSLGGPSPR